MLKHGAIRVGLVGLGRAGVQMHLSELDSMPDLFTLVAGCDVDPARTGDFQKRYPSATAYQNADDLFADPDVELVSIAVPSRLHVSMACRALAAGKTVFLEKPFALSQEGLDRLREADGRYPGKLFLRHNRRFEACYNHILELMDSGIAGEIREIKLRRLRHRFRDDWQTRLDCGGGQLNNWGPHLIDQSLHLLQSDLAFCWSDLKCIAARGDAEDHIKIIFKGKNGRVIDLEISDAVPVNEPVISVYGTRGTLFSKDECTIIMRVLDPSFPIPPAVSRTETPPIFGKGVYSVAPEPVWMEKEIPVAPSNHFEMTDIYRHLYRAIRENVPFPVKNEEGFRTVSVTLAIRAEHPEFASAGDFLN